MLLRSALLGVLTDEHKELTMQFISARPCVVDGQPLETCDIVLNGVKVGNIIVASLSQCAKEMSNPIPKETT